MCPKQTLTYFLKELISSSISYTRQRVPQKTLKTMTKNQNCHSLQLKVCSLMVIESLLTMKNDITFLFDKSTHFLL